MTRNEQRRPRRGKRSYPLHAPLALQRPRDNRPAGRPTPQRRGTPAEPHRGIDRLVALCVGAGSVGIPSILALEILRPDSVALTAIGAISVAAFGAATTVQGRRRRH